MAVRHSKRFAPGWVVAVLLCVTLTAAAASLRAAFSVPLAVSSGQVSIAGTSNIHAYTASTTDVRVVRVRLAEGLAGPNFWNDLVKPGAVEAFEIAIPAAKLSSPREGLDKNMHKALKVTEHPDITFRLLRLEEKAGMPGTLRAQGVLKIAGVERQVSFDVTTRQNESTLTVKGEMPLLMTDYGIKPPVAMLGMLKTDPKVTVSFETVLALPQSPTSTIH